MYRFAAPLLFSLALTSYAAAEDDESGETDTGYTDVAAESTSPLSEATIARAPLPAAESELATAPVSPPVDGTSVLLVADPQLTHVAGHALKSSRRVADRGVNVAIRPPVLNLLAPLALDSLVRGAKSASAPVALVLGDVANVGCSSELHTFERTMNSSITETSSRLWLAAHGNHDSYLMGNFGSYVPVQECSHASSRVARIPCSLIESDSPEAMEGCGRPSDYAWWSGAQSFWGAYERGQLESWPAMCGSPDASSYPINKAVWLAWYLEHLIANGGQVSSVTPDGDGLAFEIKGVEGSILHDLGFRGLGYWRNPACGSLPDVYDSFIVQRIDVADSRIVMIDTSVGVSGLAGSNARLGARQMRMAATLSRESDETSLVIAGHFPLADLEEVDRGFLLDLLSERGRGGSGCLEGKGEYWSGHTHASTSTGTAHGVAEINIGSTTDWPMEVAVRNLSESILPEGLTVYSLGPESMPLAHWWTDGESFLRSTVDETASLAMNSEDVFPTVGSRGRRRSQACSHVNDAREIRDRLTSNELDAMPWNQDRGGTCSGAATAVAALELVDLQNEIMSAIASSDHARELALRFVIGASSSEGVQSGLFGTSRRAQNRRHARRHRRAMGDPLPLSCGEEDDW